MIRIAIELSLFELVGSREENGKTSKELATLTGAEESLIGISDLFNVAWNLIMTHASPHHASPNSNGHLLRARRAAICLNAHLKGLDGTTINRRYQALVEALDYPCGHTTRKLTRSHQV